MCKKRDAEIMRVRIYEYHYLLLVDKALLCGVQPAEATGRSLSWQDHVGFGSVGVLALHGIAAQGVLLFPISCAVLRRGPRFPKPAHRCSNSYIGIHRLAAEELRA